MATIITNNGNIYTTSSLVLAVSQSNNLKVDGLSAVYLTASSGAVKVGINTVAPGYTLHVNGDTNITNTLLMNGSTLADASKNVFAANVTASNIYASGTIWANQFSGSFQGTITDAVTASYAKTASWAFNQSGGFVSASNIYTPNNLYVGGNTVIAGNLTVQGSASVVSVTSSVIVGSNKILVNAYSPFQRYAGISATDSGSVADTTGSIFWDSLNNYWLLQGTGNSQASVNSSSVIIGGPVSTFGNETLLTVNTIPKATTGTNIGNSLLSDNGSQLSYTGVNGISASVISASAIYANTMYGSAATASYLSGANAIVTNLTATNITGSISGSSISTGNANIDGGSIDGTIIGANSAAAATFTNITASNTRITGNEVVVGNINVGSITTTGAASFASITASTTISASYITASALDVDRIYGVISLVATSITGSLLGTASVAINAISASYASGSVITSNLSSTGTATFTNITASGTISASYITASSIIASSISGITNLTATSITASLFGTASVAVTASYAKTASYFGNGTNNYVPLWNNNTLTATSSIFQNSSNIGIGTVNPQAKLDVVGSIVLSGFIQNQTSTLSSSFMGPGAGAGSTSNHSIFFGTSAGENVSGNDVNALGYFAGYQAGSSTDSNFFGYEAGYASNALTNKNFFGYQAGKSATNAGDSNFMGYQAGLNASDADSSNFFGHSAGDGAVTANGSNFLGYEAGKTAYSSEYANFLGYQAGYQSTNGLNSIFIGYRSGYQATNAAYSIFIGTQAGYQDTVDNSVNVGSSSILIGDYTSTGGYPQSIAIGQGTRNFATASLNLANVIYATNIGTSATATSASAVNSKVGIGTYTPVNKLDVVGNISCSVITASLFFGTASVAINAISASYVNGNVVTSNLSSTGIANFANITSSGTISASYITASSIIASNISGITSLTATSITASISASYIAVANLTGLSLSSTNITASNISASKITASYITTIGLTATSITASLFGTASNASFSLSSSYLSGAIGIVTSLTATNLTASNVLSASYITASAIKVNNIYGVSNITATSITASLFGSSSYASASTVSVSSSYALTASYSVASANAFIQNGNSFGTTATLGTNDANSLVFETNTTARLTLDTTGALTSSVKIVPASDANAAYTLGTSAVRWNDIYAVQSTIGALFESGLREEGISKYKTGTVLSWKNGKLIPCDEEFDEMVMGVVQYGKDEPIVFGAEPILVTGKVNEGDYIVTSNKIGHGMGVARGSINPLELFSKVIAQSLESCDGDSCVIKSMIRKM